MRIFDKAKTTELTEYDLKKGYLKEDKIVTIIPEVPEITAEQKAKELAADGVEVTEINGAFYRVLHRSSVGSTVSAINAVPAIPKHEETETIQIYIPYTEEEIQHAEQKKYENTVDMLIRERYSLSNELAILRQRDSKPEEFSEYNSFVEECKAKAKEVIKEDTENEEA